MSKIYIENSTFMEYIDELATQITEMNYGAETWIEDEGVMRFTDEAQDFYNDTYDEYETLTNNMLGVYSNTELDNMEDVARKYRELKLNEFKQAPKLKK
jgi:hypothetical protein|tara:strand:+ start:75 stop:371 length:297 start_codon:yes stop_codon:yes gene_type:complete